MYDDLILQGNIKSELLKVLCYSRSETFHQISATFYSSFSSENSATLKAATP